ncbi:MAG TPA: GtrA family protein [Sulfurimonas autotrophica]|nr:GtrA family protein [Sulfurimonas autotrophica]
MNIKSHIIQLAKYGFFGVIATLVHLFTAWAIIYFFATSVFVANTLAFFTAFVFSYIFQTLYVFHSTFHIKKIVKFFSVQYGTFLFSYLVSDVFVIQNSYLHTLIIVAIMPLITFVIHKFWTFKEF